MGMVVTPTAIELEEVIRQAIPTTDGRPDISALRAGGPVGRWA